MPKHHLDIEGVPFEWDTDQSVVTQLGQELALLWADPALRALVETIREQLGTGASAHVLRAWGRRTGGPTAERLRALGALDPATPEGRARLLAVYRVGGWGVTEIASLDVGAREVRMRVRSSWEARLKAALGDGGRCAFLPQHWAGVWSAYFGVPCAAEEVECESQGAAWCAYRIYASPDAAAGPPPPPALQREHRRAAALEAAERRAREQEELAAAAADLASALDVDEQLRRVARRAHLISGADYTAVATIEPNGRAVWRAVEGNVSDAWRTVETARGAGMAGRVVARDDTVIVTGFPDNPIFPPEEFPVQLAEGMRTAFGVPIRGGGTPFGAVVVGWRREVEVDWDTIALVQTLADIAAAAITQSQLVASLRQRATELEAASRERDASYAELQRHAASEERRAAALEAANHQLEVAGERLEQQAEETALLNAQLEQRNAELHTAASELDAVLEQMADGVIIAGPDGRIIRANPAADRLHGQPVIGHRGSSGELSIERFNVRRLDGTPYTPDELPLTRALHDGETVEGAEWMVQRPDGSLVRLLGSAAPLRRPDGRTIGAVLVMRDITERERLAEQLRQATSAKERFFAQMSHELRTPVNAIVGYSQLLTEGMAGELPPKAHEMLGRVRRSAQHLLELVNDVLDISRLEAGKMTVEPQEVDLAALVRDTLTTVEPMAQHKGLALEVDVPASLPAFTDARRVRQILLNLLSNAVKFTERGSVRVELRELPLMAQGDGDAGVPHAELAVADTGVGIAPEDQERVFAEFVQVGPKPGGGGGGGGDAVGTGLGLAITRRLAHLLGGELRVESEVGRGSRFICTLPLRFPGRGRE